MFKMPESLANLVETISPYTSTNQPISPISILIFLPGILKKQIIAIPISSINALTLKSSIDLLLNFL